MNKQYDNTNRGILFENDRKEKDSHPDFKGSINVGGTEFWLSGWRKETSKGPAISMQVEAKDDAKKTAQRAAQAAKQAESAPDPFDDYIPF